MSPGGPRGQNLVLRENSKEHRLGENVHLRALFFLVSNHCPDKTKYTNVSTFENSTDPNPLLMTKPSDHDLHCFPCSIRIQCIC